MRNKATKYFLIFAFSIFIFWTGMYFHHFKQIVPHVRFIKNLDAVNIASSYSESIEPILIKKCGSCHIESNSRPFFYHLPIINLWTKPYVENELRSARQKFDITNGISDINLGTIMEKIISLRQVIQNDAMPPTAYHMARPYQKINKNEKETILSWTRQALAPLNKELFSTNEYYRSLPKLSPKDLGKQLSSRLAAASPLSRSNDKHAHELAAEKLANDVLLKTRSNVSFLWGGQKNPGNFNINDAHMNRFNPLAWRKYYLSLFMFSGDYEMIENEGTTAYLFPVTFRGELGDGAYPYPFWHSEEKWRKYNEAKYLILIVSDGRIVAAMRSANKLESIPEYSLRIWDGKFRWFDHKKNVQQPAVTNYDQIFSAKNPHATKLGLLYRQLALGFRAENCVVCHAPSNKAKMKMLEMLWSPLHTLSAKDRLVAVLEANQMPPLSGISNHETKSTLIDIAKQFQETADLALIYEGEPVLDNLSTRSWR